MKMSSFCERPHTRLVWWWSCWGDRPSVSRSVCLMLVKLWSWEQQLCGSEMSSWWVRSRSQNEVNVHEWTQDQGESLGETAWQSKSSQLGWDIRIKSKVGRRQVTKQSKTGDHKPRDIGITMINFYFVYFCSKSFLLLYIDLIYFLNILGTDLCNYICLASILFVLYNSFLQRSAIW